jgi:HD-GYP domain-containing protein (c-di-GMP phosphodiesterase class II)
MKVYGKIKDSQSRESRESARLLLVVLGEHDNRALENLNKVARLAFSIAEYVGLSDYEVERIELAGRLHDVGKVAIPDSILRKPGPLTPQEWAIMRTHSEIGERIVRAAPTLEYIADIVRWHHERHDGCGYPDRLSGDGIPLGARIVAVCAGFVAMMKQRPFSDAITVAEALAEIRRGSGTQFHPQIVEAFSELLQKAVALPFQAESESRRQAIPR